MDDTSDVKTVQQQIAEDAEAILVDLKELLRLSRLIRREPRRFAGMTVIDAQGNMEWQALSPEGRRLQSKLSLSYTHFSHLLEVLLEGQVEDLRNENAQAKETVFPVIQQRHNTWADGTAELMQSVEEAVRNQAKLVDSLYSVSDHPVYVPDTNAILYNPAIETWAGLRASGLVLCLAPTVLGELDELKVRGNEMVRKKAESFIRRFKEYARRGQLRDGVTISGKLRLMSLATEPKGQFFDWMDMSNNDDRLIASMLEVMRRNVSAPVIMVTRDINLQNKCAHARLPWVEPPDPVFEAG